MKEKYIDLMEKALSAYTDEHILRYFGDVKTNGLKEHGFPRLTANMVKRKKHFAGIWVQSI